jgi:hypothetical protein
MADKPKPPDVGQKEREAIARKLVDLARPLLDEAARLLDVNPNPDKEPRP